MAEGLVRSIFNAAAVAADSEVVDAVTKTWNGFVLQTTGFSGTLDIMGRMKNADWMHALYAVREDGDDVYGTASDDQLTYTTDTSQYYIALAEPYAQLQVLMDRSAGSVTLDLLEGAPSPLIFQVVPINVEEVTVGAVTIADGADEAEGATDDTAVVDPAAANATVISLLRGILSDQNTDIAVLNSEASTTATRTSADLTNRFCKGIRLHLNTANKDGTTATYTPSVQVKIGAIYKTVWTASAAVTGNGDATYLLYPGASQGSDTEKVSIAIGKTFRVVLTVASADGDNNMDTLMDAELIR